MWVGSDGLLKNLKRTDYTTSMIACIAAAVLSVSASHQLHVEGTKIVDEQGLEFRIHGVNIPSLEWAAKGEHMDESVPTAFDKWQANFIRVPLSQDRWFGKAPDSGDDGSNYRSIVDSVVKQAESRGKYVLLDLHWSDCGAWGKDIGQHALPDANSLTFWKDCAKRFANRAAVWFDLYNEPIEAPWAVWRDGGDVTETFNGKKMSYPAVGLQTLLTAIRGVGAKNLIVAGGLGYSSRLDGILVHPLEEEGGFGVVYADHFYPGWGSVEDWEPTVVAFSKKLPLVISEFGADPKMNPLDDPARRVLDVLDVLKRNDFNWVAWCFHPAASPCLIEDWTFKPTSYFGVNVLAALKGSPLLAPVRVTALPSATIYDGKLENGFQSWGSAAVDFASTLHYAEHASMRVDLKGDKRLQLGAMPFDGLPYKAISFWIHGGDNGNQTLHLAVNIMDREAGSVALPNPQAGKWTKIEVPFSKLGVEGRDHVKSFSIRGGTSDVEPFYVADITLVGKS